MKDADRYAKIVQWSDEDRCFIGRVPDLCDGGCHGPDPKAVFDEICEIAEEWVEYLKEQGTPLPAPTNFVTANDEGVLATSAALPSATTRRSPHR